MTDVMASALLLEAADLIAARAADRDLPQERSMGRAVRAFNALSGQTLTETQGWLFMVVLKLSRALAGGFNRDDLLDGAAYMALALECELQNTSQTAPEAPQAPIAVDLASEYARSAEALKKAILIQEWRKGLP